MGKIIIMEDKADHMVEKLEDMKDCVCYMLECLSESMEGHRDMDDEEDDWDDEYEVKRRRGSRRGMRRGMRGGRSGGSRY